MGDYSATLGVSSSLNSSRPRPIYVEPWGEDYWLFPGDSFEIVALSHETLPSFNMVETDESTQIYLEGGCHDFAVKLHGLHIEGGYQRAKLVGNVTDAFEVIRRGVVITSEKLWLGRLAVGDQLRLLIPKGEVISARVLSLEHLNEGPGVILENPWGLFLGELEIGAGKILPGTPVYRLENLPP